LEKRKEFEKTKSLSLFFKKSKNIQQKKSSKKSKYDSDVREKIKGDFTKYLPLIVLWLARVLMFILTYLYHVHASIIHLSWIILSFLIPKDKLFFVSIVGMVPILSWEFLLVYGSRLPII